MLTEYISLIDANKRILVLFLFISVLMAMFMDPILFPDSASYINFSSVRSIGYPWIISLFKLMFGDNYLSFIVGFQVFSVLSISYWLAEEIRNIVGADKSLQGVIFLLTLYPWFLSASLTWGLVVLTESLTYCATIPVIILSLRLMREYRFQNLVLLLFCLGLALSFRLHTIFLGGGMMVLSLCLVIFKRYREAQVWILSSFMVIALIMLMNTLNVSWHGGKHNNVFALSQALVPALYTMNQNTLDEMSSNQAKEILIPIHNQLSKRCLNMDSLTQQNCGPIDKTHFLFSYNKIYYEVMAPAIGGYLKRHKGMNDESVYKLLLSTLLAHELSYQPTRLVGHYLKTIITFGLHGKYMFLGFLVLCLVITVRGVYNRDIQSQWLAICVLYHISNLILIVLFEPHCFRYIFYTEVPIAITLLAGFLHWMYQLRLSSINNQPKVLKW